MLAMLGFFCTSTPVGAETFPRGKVEVKPRKNKIFYRQGAGKRVEIFNASSS